MAVLAVVDDDPLFHFIVERLNKKFPAFSIISSYSNGKDFIDYLTENIDVPGLLPDTVLIDLHMPGLSGWTVLDSFANIYNMMSKKMLVFVVSSSVYTGDQIRAEAYEFVESYITKPLTEAFFLSASYIFM